MRVIPPAPPAPPDPASSPCPLPRSRPWPAIIIHRQQAAPEADFSDDRPNSIRCSTAKSARSSSSSASRTASRSRRRAFCPRSSAISARCLSASSDSCRFASSAASSASSSEASAPLASGTTPAATVTQHSKHPKHPQITHPPACRCQQPPVDVSSHLTRPVYVRTAPGPDVRGVYSTTCYRWFRAAVQSKNRWLVVAHSTLLAAEAAVAGARGRRDRVLGDPRLSRFLLGCRPR